MSQQDFNRQLSKCQTFQEVTRLLQSLGTVQMPDGQSRSQLHDAVVRRLDEVEGIKKH